MGFMVVVPTHSRRGSHAVKHLVSVELHMAVHEGGICSGHLAIWTDANHDVNRGADLDMQVRNVIASSPVAAAHHPSVTTIDGFGVQQIEIRSQGTYPFELFAGDFPFSLLGSDTEDLLDELAGPILSLSR